MNTYYIRYLILIGLQINIAMFATYQAPHCVFSHGFGADKEQVTNYRKFFDSKSQFHSFDYPDVEKVTNVSFAQKNEIETLDKEIELFKQQLQEQKADSKNMVLIGLSRGASNALMWLGTNPDKCDRGQIAAVILESPFDSLESVLDNMWFGQRWVLQTALLFSNYNKNHKKPIDIVQNIPKELPILILCSKEDALIPYKSSMRLYNALKQSGHTQVHLAVLNYGEHANLAWGKDKDLYTGAVIEFLRKYNLFPPTTLI